MHRRNQKPPKQSRVKLGTPSVVAACTGGDLFIDIATSINLSQQKFLIYTGS